MQINNNIYTSNEQKPNFTAIRSIKYSGLYKKQPECVQQLLSAFKENPQAVDFCKKYDVDIVFHAIKDGIDMIKSSLVILYKDPSKSKLAKFFGNNEDKIHLSAFSKTWFGGLEDATNALVEYIIPATKGKPATGVLSSHIAIADEKIQKGLNSKAQKAAIKASKAMEKANKATKLSSDTEQLSASIDEFMKNINL